MENLSVLYACMASKRTQKAGMVKFDQKGVSRIGLLEPRMRQKHVATGRQPVVKSNQTRAALAATGSFHEVHLLN